MNFLLVDYKGAAAFKDCQDLPHTVGLVTDHLDPIDPTRSYYLCGPPGMISAAEGLLLTNGVPRDRIRVERFLETGDEQP